MFDSHPQKSKNGLRRGEIRGGLLVLIQENGVKLLIKFMQKGASYQNLTNRGVHEA